MTITFTNPWADLRKAQRAGLPTGETVPMHRGPLSRWAARLALVFAGLAVVSLPLSYWLYDVNSAKVHTNYVFGDYVAGLLYPLVGAYLLRRRPDNRVGWVFAATSVIGINAVASQYAVTATFVHQDLPLRDVAAWLGGWAWSPELAVPALLPLLFPDGTLSSRRWRPVAAVAIGALTAMVVSLAFSHHPIDATDRIYNPWALPHSGWLLVVSRVSIFAVLICTVVGLVSMVRRARSAQGASRAQLQWLLFSVVVTVVLGVAAMPLPGAASEVMWAFAMAAIPAGVVIAVVRHQMFDIELVLNRTIAYALITGAVVIGYVLAVSALGEVAAKKLGVAAVAVVALLIASARDRVQRAVDHALFGDRRDPYSVVDRLGRSVDAAQGPVDALQQMAAELRDALRLPSVAVVADSPQVATIEVGASVAGTVDVPITVHGASVGVLRIGRRHHNERLRAEEESVLHDAARRAGALLQAAVYVADLSASRERIVAAREEERRRLRHDLHDGVGPQLAGLALQLDSLGRRLGADPDNAARVQMLRERLRDTVVEVRRVVDNLRPPALDDVGLLEAVRQQVSAYAVQPPADAGGVAVAVGPIVEVESDAALPALPAAVEVAAYRIVTEAVANAVRHGRPSRCAVGIRTVGDELVVSVSDDGSGITADAVPGVGLASMRERAAEVGGALDVRSDTSGTTVTARLPLELS